MIEKHSKKSPRILSVANQKGGVGKTTTTVNLATSLAAVGKKVLVMDLDPQGNASTGFGVGYDRRDKGVYEVLFGDCALDDAITETQVPKLYIVSSSADLAGAELELIDVPNRESCIKTAIEKSEAEFDYIIFDCPPSLNLLTLNAFVASSGVIVPLQCEFYALEGVSHLVKTIGRVNDAYNPDLKLQGIVLTMFDKRNNLSLQVEEDVRGHFGDKVYKTVIPRNVRVSEAPSYGLPAIVYDMKCPGSQAYIKLAREVLKREKAEKHANQEAA